MANEEHKDKNEHETAETVEELEAVSLTGDGAPREKTVDDDGHTLEDITPMEIDEDDDDETAENAEDDPDEYKNWDRDELGPMADYAVEEDEEPHCCSEDDEDFEPGE